MTLEALIFDLDGTMADTEEVHRQAFNAAFIKLELWWDWGPLRYAELLEVSSGVERLHRYVDSLNVDAAEKARLHAIVPVIHFTKSEIYLDLLRSWKPILRPGVKRLVGEARDQGLQVAVVSTSATANARAVLDNHFQGEIALLVAADEVARRKPAPDIYQRALALLRKPAAACIAFEDSANGLRAARAAGLATIVTPSRWTMAQDFVRPNALVPDLGRMTLEEVRRIHHAARGEAGRAAA
jgi:HAD superfamily hydrolase (TIGR01509 family)